MESGLEALRVDSKTQQTNGDRIFLNGSGLGFGECSRDASIGNLA